MSKLNYKTSKDYPHLKDLLDGGKEVVCFTTYDFRWMEREEHEPMWTTDVCTARKDENGRYYFAVRGCEFTSYWPGMHRYASFEEACADSNIEFIEPNGEE